MDGDGPAAGRAQGASFMYGFCIVLGIICAAVFSYVFPLLARFENTVKKTLKEIEWADLSARRPKISGKIIKEV